MVRAAFRGAVMLLPWTLVGCYVGANSSSAGGAASAEGGDESDSASEESGGDAAPAPAGSCGDLQIGSTPLRRLTALQFDNTIRDLLHVEGSFSTGLAPDERIGPFRSNSGAPLGELEVEQYGRAAEAAAAAAIEQLGTLLPCDPASVGEDECAREFVESFAPRAYRRPLEAADIDRLMSVYLTGKTEGGFENGLRVLIAAMLQSPFFLYLVEFDSDDVQPGEPSDLEAYALATRLSYFLWGTLPDALLFAAADSGALSTDEGLAAEVDRMLEHPKAAQAIADFHLQWLGVEELDEHEKNTALFPAYDVALANAMKDETRRFSQWVFAEGDGRIDTLLTAPYAFTEDPALLALYGVSSLPADHVPGAPVALDPAQRAGLLTQASLMTKQAHADQTSPVHRGVWVRQNVLCQPLPPPPPDVDNVPPQVDPNATTRQRFDQHRADPSCAGCHDLIDPIGFGFENYDAIGGWRDFEGEFPVDASGELLATDVNGAFVGAPQLAARLADSQQVQQCVARQWFRFALGRNESAADQCSLDAVFEALAESDGDMRELLRELVLADSFRFRRSTTEEAGQ